MKKTANELAKEFEMDTKTISAALTRAGMKTGRGAKFTVRQVHDALTRKSDSKGNLQEERLLKLRAERRLAEKELEEKEGNLLPVDEAQEMVSHAFVPVRQRLLALPAEASARTNPSDPQHARAVLQQWVDDGLALIREGLPKLKEK